LAEEFRGAYREAAAHGGFPVTVREAAYTEDQLGSQVSLLLAQVDELPAGNVAVVQGNSLRNQEGLLAASQNAHSYRPSADKARKYLADKPAVHQVETAIREDDANDLASKPHLNKVSRQQKPILQQPTPVLWRATASKPS